jgi:hypothetical protein
VRRGKYDLFLHFILLSFYDQLSYTMHFFSGLYDPPPVGSEEQASQYMSLNLDGGATVLFPYLMDQDPETHPGSGWVTSLDWTPGDLRYQVDRKVNGGKGLLGLRTLELSEVQGATADTWRPNDGGSNMRQ